MTESEILEIANALVKPHGLTAEFLPGIYSVGVGGDARTYLLVMCLTGPSLGQETLQNLASQISSRTPVNRVTFELAHQTGGTA